MITTPEKVTQKLIHGVRLSVPLKSFLCALRQAFASSTTKEMCVGEGLLLLVEDLHQPLRRRIVTEDDGGSRPGCALWERGSGYKRSSTEKPLHDHERPRTERYWQAYPSGAVWSFVRRGGLDAELTKELQSATVLSSGTEKGPGNVGLQVA